MRTLHVIHICAPNDRNGNPRRAFLVYDGEEYLGAVDEGYRGNGALAHLGGSNPIREGGTVRILARVPTTTAFYRECLRSEMEGISR